MRLITVSNVLAVVIVGSLLNLAGIGWAAQERPTKT